MSNENNARPRADRSKPPVIATARTSADLTGYEGYFVRRDEITGLLSPNTTAGSHSSGVLKRVFQRGNVQFAEYYTSGIVACAPKDRPAAGIEVANSNAGLVVERAGGALAAGVSMGVDTDTDRVIVRLYETGSIQPTGAAALVTAKAYADAKDVIALAAAEAYTDDAIADLVIYGTLGRPSAINPISGTRPLASSVPLGTRWIALDGPYAFTAQVHPFDPASRIWNPTAPMIQRAVAGVVVAGVNAISSRQGVYDPAANTFTMAGVAGQDCNATAASAANVGLTITVNVTPILGNIPASMALGTQFMTDNAGQLVPYVAGAGIVALGVVLSEATGIANALFYFY